MSGKIIIICVFCFSNTFNPLIHCSEKEPGFSTLNEVIGHFESQNLALLLQLLDTYAISTGENIEKGKEIFSTLLFRNPDWKSIDFNQSLVYLFLDPNLSKNPLFYAIHTTNIENFLSSFGRSLLSSEPYILLPNKHPHKIKEYLDKQIQFDRKSFLKALKSGQDINPENFQTVLTKSYYVYLNGDLILVSGDLDLLIKIIENPDWLSYSQHNGPDLSFSYAPTQLMTLLKHSYGSYSKVLETDYMNKDMAQQTTKMTFDLFISEKDFDGHLRLIPAESSKLIPLVQSSMLSLISQEALSKVIEGTSIQNITIDSPGTDTLEPSRLNVFKKNDQTPYPVYYYFIKNTHVFSQTPIDSSILSVKLERIKQNEGEISIYFIIPTNAIMQTFFYKNKEEISK